MRVAQAIELLKELPPDAYICAQWYDQEDMTKPGEELTDKIWAKAHEIWGNYEDMDMYYAVEQAIDEARIALETEREPNE